MPRGKGKKTAKAVPKSKGGHQHVPGTTRVNPLDGTVIKHCLTCNQDYTL